MMKRIVLVLILLFPVMAFAQENDPKLVKNENSRADVAVQLQEAPPNSVASVDFGVTSGTLSPTAPDKPTPSKNKPSEKPKPKIPGSMVGYIDNAIVESEIRVRFDAAFNDEFPDRAEFFYAKCGCYRALPSGNPARDPNAPGPPPGSAMSAIPKDLNFQQLYIDGEFAPIRRFSMFTEIPVRWIQAQGIAASINNGTFPNQGGLSDIMAGFKFAAIASERTYLTFQVRSYFPSGDASKGLGTNHYSVEPGVLYYQSFSDRLTLEAQVRDWHPIGGSAGVSSAIGVAPPGGFAGDVFMYGVGPSYVAYNGEHVQFTPVIELFGWSVLGGYETEPGHAPSAGGINIVNIKIGARTSFGAHSSIYVGYGRPLTSADWYNDIVRIEYRYAF
jgi:hypothetical protein